MKRPAPGKASRLASLAIALLGLTCSYRLHRCGEPLPLGLAAAALLLWVFYGRYSHPLEALGVVGLVAASAGDFRAKHFACPSATRKGNP